MSFDCFDAVIIGGSYAGLSAAMQLGRASRSVAVIDSGRPRNRHSAAVHGATGWDGVSQREILERFRSDLSAYPTISFIETEATGVCGAIDEFLIEVDEARSLKSRRLILAHGVRDVLPSIPGLAEGWGKTVLHCPYCHGYEVRRRAIGVLATGAMAAHQAQMLRADWSSDVTLMTNGLDGFDDAGLSSACVKMEERRVAAMEPGDGVCVRFAEGPDARYAAIFVATRADLTGSPAETLGVALDEGPLGPFVQTGPMMQTSIPGVLAAGDLATQSHSVSAAVGDGARAGVGCHQSLLFPEFVPSVVEAA